MTNLLLLGNLYPVIVVRVGIIVHGFGLSLRSAEPAAGSPTTNFALVSVTATYISVPVVG